MFVGLFLKRRAVAAENNETELVGYCKTLEEITNWYTHHIKQDTLKDFIPLEECMYHINSTPIGFIEVQSLEELMQELEEQQTAIFANMQNILDDYRTNVEPKAVFFNANSITKPTLQ